VSSLLTAVEGETRRWTLNRPEARNALSAELVDRLLEAAAAAAADRNCRVVVLDAAGTVFCAGSDVAALASLSAPDAVAHESRWPLLRDAFASVDAPIVASVRGAAVGGGLMLLLFTDVRVCEARTFFALPEVSLGWLPPGGLEELIAEVGIARARRLVLLGKRWRAADALAAGIVDEVAAAGELETRVAEAARYLTSLPQASAASAKRYFRSRSGSAAALDRLQLDEFARCLETPEAVRSLRRFASGATRSVAPGRPTS